MQKNAEECRMSSYEYIHLIEHKFDKLLANYPSVLEHGLRTEIESENIWE